MKSRNRRFVNKKVFKKWRRGFYKIVFLSNISFCSQKKGSALFLLFCLLIVIHLTGGFWKPWSVEKYFKLQTGGYNFHKRERERIRCSKQQNILGWHTRVIDAAIRSWRISFHFTNNYLPIQRRVTHNSKSNLRSYLTICKTKI